MGSFAIMRGSKAEINDTPIVDGQLFIDIDQSNINVLDSTRYSDIYIDNNTNRIKLGITEWDNLVKPFNFLDNETFDVDSLGVLSVKGIKWTDIINKPFESMGEHLKVVNNKLELDIKWNEVTNKPFYTVGEGLNVDSNGNLNSDVFSVNVSQIGTASASDVSYQSLVVNNINSEIKETKYMEYTQPLNTTGNTIYTFNNSNINTDSIVEVYTSIWGVNPIEINVTNNTCIITFPEYNTANTDLTCRIYIL